MKFKTVFPLNPAEMPQLATMTSQKEPKGAARKYFMPSNKNRPQIKASPRSRFFCLPPKEGFSSEPIRFYHVEITLMRVRMSSVVTIPNKCTWLGYYLATNRHITTTGMVGIKNKSSDLFQKFSCNVPFSLLLRIQNILSLM